MMLIKARQACEAGSPPSQEIMAGMAKFTEENVKTGALVGMGALAPSSNGMRVKYVDGQRFVTDGPFTETKELIGGYIIVEADSRGEALRLADQVLDVHVKAGVVNFDLEIRPFSQEINFDTAK